MGSPAPPSTAKYWKLFKMARLARWLLKITLLYSYISAKKIPNMTFFLYIILTFWKLPASDCLRFQYEVKQKKNIYEITDVHFQWNEKRPNRISSAMENIQREQQKHNGKLPTSHWIMATMDQTMWCSQKICKHLWLAFWIIVRAAKVNEHKRI